MVFVLNMCCVTIYFILKEFPLTMAVHFHNVILALRCNKCNHPSRKNHLFLRLIFCIFLRRVVCSMGKVLNKETYIVGNESHCVGVCRLPTVSTI